jgi:adenine-specific DNA-methyltransferase
VLSWEGGALIVSYMGTKRHLAHHVRQLASDCPSGPLLDGFSGMCAIGQSLASDRQIWSNDLQAFAHEVALAQFCSAAGKIGTRRMIAAMEPLVEENLTLCRSAFSLSLQAEALALEERDVEQAEADFQRSSIAANNLSVRNSCLPSYTLLAARYGGTYFGHMQSCEGDSIRYGLDALLDREEIDKDSHRWGLIALCAAMSKVSTTTGHFAQPLKPKTGNSTKHFSQRGRSVWNEWVALLPSMKALGSRSWRRKNKAFRGDTIDLLKDLQGSGDHPSLIYADPPYTKDQYSRYYHVLETIILYDYPDCHGSGLYRADRASSTFSQSSQVEEALDHLIEGAKKLSAALILSYPAEGLLKNSTSVIPRIIYEHYGSYPDILEIDYKHSTMGASKGRDKHEVREILYRAVA